MKIQLYIGLSNTMYSNVSSRKKDKPTNQREIINFFTKIGDDAPVSVLPKPMKEESSINFDAIQTQYDDTNTNISRTASTSSSSSSNYDHHTLSLSEYSSTMSLDST